MTMGLIGRKCGMTQLYAENGTVIPVTLIEIQPNRVVQIKTKERDGYESIQVTTGKKLSSRLNKAEAGHFAKAAVEPGINLWELRITEEDHEFLKGISLGMEMTIDKLFKLGTYVDVTGTNKGKGFAGVVKRYHFSTQDATHGNSLSHRAPGSIGQRQSPGRLFKGKKMCGQLGNRRCTVQSLEIVRIDTERHLLHIKGAVPGAPGGQVIVKQAVRKKNKQNKG